MVQSDVVRRLRTGGILAVATIAFAVVVQAAVIEYRFATAPVQADQVNRSGLRRALTMAILYDAERSASDRTAFADLNAAAAELDAVNGSLGDLSEPDLGSFERFESTARQVAAHPGDAAARLRLRSQGVQLYATFDRATNQIAHRGNVQRATSRAIVLVACAIIVVTLAALYVFVMRRRESAIESTLKALEERTQRFAAMFDNAIDMMCVYDAKGAIVRANPSALARLGFGNEAVGKPYAIHVARDERASAEREFAEALAGRAVEFSTTFLTSSGEEVPVLASLAPIEVAGTIVGVVGSARDITIEKQFEAKLLHSRERFRSLFMGSQHSVLAVDAEGTVVDANDAFEHLSGLRAEQVIGKQFTALVPLHRRDVAQARFAEILAGNTRTYETTTLTSDGREVPVAVDAAPIRVGDRIEGVFYTSRDITSERALRRQLDEKDQRVSTLLQVAGLPWDASVQIDEAIFLGTEALGMAYGYVVRIEGETMTVLHRHGPDEVLPIGMRMQMTQSIGLKMASSARALAIGDLTIEPYASELRDRELPWKSFIGTRINVAGAPFGAVVFLDRDVRKNPFEEPDVDFVDVLSSMLATAVAREVRGEELRAKATRDKLTGLANRAMLEELFARMLAHAKRSGEGLSVHYIDLDGFKPVNDTYGHAAGDEVLRQVARRFGAVVRGEDVVARIGGDEFVVLQGTAEDAAVEGLASRLRAVLDLPIELSVGVSVFVGASGGIGRFPADGDDLQSVLQAADAAMYRDKRAKAMGA